MWLSSCCQFCSPARVYFIAVRTGSQNRAIPPNTNVLSLADTYLLFIKVLPWTYIVLFCGVGRRPSGHWLGVGFLQQSAPVLVVGFGVAVDELSVDGGQSVVHHHVQPFPEDPELKVEDPGIVLGPFGVPLLLIVVRYYLEVHTHTHTHKHTILLSDWKPKFFVQHEACQNMLGGKNVGNRSSEQF